MCTRCGGGGRLIKLYIYQYFNVSKCHIVLGLIHQDAMSQIPPLQVLRYMISR